MYFHPQAVARALFPSEQDYCWEPGSPYSLAAGPWKGLVSKGGRVAWVERWTDCLPFLLCLGVWAAGEGGGGCIRCVPPLGVYVALIFKWEKGVLFIGMSCHCGHLIR